MLNEHIGRISFSCEFIDISLVFDAGMASLDGI